MNKRITKLLAMAMPLAFVLLGTLAFSACVEDNATAGGGGGGGEGGGDAGSNAPTCEKSTSPAFVSRWDLTKTSNLRDTSRNSLTIGSGEKSIKLPLVEDGTYNFKVYWGDSKTSTITAWNSTEATHTYAEAAITANGGSVFTVVITGTIEGWRFGNGKSDGTSDALKLTEINSFGPLSLGATEGHQFYDAANLTITASDAPTLCNTKNLSAAFAIAPNTNHAKNFNSDISSWDVSAVTNMQSMFWNAISFNADISSWDVSKVTNMKSMFLKATDFDQPLNDWNVSKVTDMEGMFSSAEAFNADISSWNVSSVTNMRNMFGDATDFNANIGSWDVSAVTDMSWMFTKASKFNQDIGSWNVSLVKNMRQMFQEDTDFNQDLSRWDVSSVTNMEMMFVVATAFNNGGVPGASDMPLTWGAKVANVQNMESMFEEAGNFNADISSWNVSKVTDMSLMFKSATDFNQDLTDWDTYLGIGNNPLPTCAGIFSGTPMNESANQIKRPNKLPNSCYQ